MTNCEYTAELSYKPQSYQTNMSDTFIFLKILHYTLMVNSIHISIQNGKRICRNQAKYFFGRALHYNIET